MAASGLLTLAGGIAGAVAGFFVGGPTGAAIGFSIGAGLAAGFEEKPGIETGRISDLRVTGASYGDNISRVYGTVPVPGSMVWTSGLVEKKDKNKEGGGLFSTGTEVTTSTDSPTALSKCCRDSSSSTRSTARLSSAHSLTLTPSAGVGFVTRSTTILRRRLRPVASEISYR